MNVLLLGLFCFVVNVPLGIWRTHTRRFSAAWVLAVHLAVPIIIAIRILSGISYVYVPLFIAFAVLGQLVGGRVCSRSAQPS